MGSNTRRSGATAAPHGPGRWRGSPERVAGMRRVGRNAGFDLAIAHGSNDLAIASRIARDSPRRTCTTTSGRLPQHNVARSGARRVIVPRRVPPEHLSRFGVGPAKLFRYPGSRRSTTSRTSRPTPRARTAGGRRGRGRSSSCARRPTSRSTTASRTRCSRRFSNRLGTDDGVHAVVLPRTPAQREYVRGLRGCPSVILLDHRRRSPEPRRARRLLRLRGRDDEPRGRCSGNIAGLHDLRWPPRWGRR